MVQPDETPEVYSLSGRFFGIGISLLILGGLPAVSILLAWVFLSPHELYSARGDVIGTLAALLVGIMLSAWGLYWILRHTGRVVLTSNAVLLHRLGRRKRLPYAQIVEVRERDRHLPPNLVLKGLGTVICISHGADRFPELSAALHRHVDVDVARREVWPDFPWRLSRRTGYYVWVVAGTIFISTLLAVLILAGTPSLRDGWLAAGVVGSAFGITLLIVVVVVLSMQPLSFHFDADRITVRHLLRGQEEWPVDRLQAVRWVRQRANAYIVRLEFEGGESVDIDFQLARECGFPLGRVYKNLFRLYRDQLDPI